MLFRSGILTAKEEVPGELQDLVCVQKDYLCNGIILTMSANKALGLDYVCNVVQSNDTRSEYLAHFVW